MQVNNLRNSGSWARLMLLGGASLLGLGALIGGGVGWHYHQKTLLRTQLSDQYFLALQGHDAQKKMTDLSKTDVKQIPEYSAIRLSDLSRKDNLDAQAKNALSPENFKSNSLKGLALLMSLNLKASHLEEAQSDRELRELKEGYKNLARTYPLWGDFAREGLVALALRPGASEEDKAEALRLLKEVISSSTPLSGMHQRATLLLQALER
ncbi:hypothetical protein FAI41_00290 [Acetobacteraceae bacterium]|nr:hypothetical protein FAI41_00290 [Acetobacteraceae bacterium]